MTLIEDGERLHLALLRLFVVALYLPLIRPLTRAALRVLRPRDPNRG